MLRCFNPPYHKRDHIHDCCGSQHTGLHIPPEPLSPIKTDATVTGHCQTESKLNPRASGCDAGVEAALTDATRLGFGEPIAISAETGTCITSACVLRTCGQAQRLCCGVLCLLVMCTTQAARTYISVIVEWGKAACLLDVACCCFDIQLLYSLA